MFSSYKRIPSMQNEWELYKLLPISTFQENYRDFTEIVHMNDLILNY